VLFIDDDTIADERLVGEHWRSHEQYPHSVVLGWVNHVDPGDRPRRRRLRVADLSTSFFWTSNVSVRRDDLVAAGLFDEAFTEYGWEDVEFGERLRDLGLARRFNPRAVVSHVKRPWRGSDVPALLLQAAASGRSAVVFVRKRPTRRAHLATGVGPLRMAANRWLEPGERWYRRRLDRAGDRRLRGLDWMAAYLWTRVAYFRAVRGALGAGAADAGGAGRAGEAGGGRTDGSARALRNVLVIRIDKIGDLLVSTPAIRNLRRALPDARITLLTSPLCADVLRGWDALDAIEVFDRGSSRGSRRQVIDALRRGRPDVIFTFTPKSPIYMLARRIGAPLRVGFGYRSRPLDVAVARVAFTHSVMSRVPEAIERAHEVPHHAEELLALLTAAGLPAKPCRMEVPIAEPDRAWVNAALAERHVSPLPIVLHLSNKWLDDGWESPDLVALLDALAAIDPGRQVVATVGPSDATGWAAARPLLRGRDNPVVVLDNLTFGRWAALVAASALVASPDTGAIHLASATGRPVVGVYAAHRFHIFSRQWGPWMVPCRTLPKERGAKGIDAIAAAVTSLLAETRAWCSQG
jgi:ADP-heptose:LPS heptosyltransferase